MVRTVEVPVTPSVVEWAIAESGYSVADIADSLGVEVDTLHGWMRGSSRPSVTPFRKLAKKLYRQEALFFLPGPPRVPPLQVEFRDIASDRPRPPTPNERRYLRRARRHQEVLSWVSDELREPSVTIPRYSLNAPAEAAGEQMRELLGVSFDDQRSWPSAAQAFDHWREAAERLGVTVFVFMLGEDSCNGFSLWHERAPVVAISSAWREEARIFTLFHELGHLATRSNSACIERAAVNGQARDPVERWCERFAATVLLPRSAVEQILQATIRNGRVEDLNIAMHLANRARVSLRAATIRLIELGLATWDLYRQIPEATDAKTGGGGGGGRNRLAIREDEVGPRGTRLYVEAVRLDVMSRSQAVDYLDIPDPAFDQLSPGSGE